MRTLNRQLCLGIVAPFALLLVSCAGTAQADPVTTPTEPAVVEVDIASCLKINPVGPVTSATRDGCLAHGAALDGFHEGAVLMEVVDYRPKQAAAVAIEIRRVASGIDDPDRIAALEVIAKVYDGIADRFSQTAETSRGSEAAYIEVMTRDTWNTYFETFFDGPDAAANAAHVVERVFVRMRGFEVD